MQAVVSTPGGERWAELRELPTPEPGPDELLVEVHAAGINRGELTLVQMREDFRPGQEIAGVVADGPRKGERVVGLADWHGWAEYATVPEHRTVPLPDDIDFATAAALPMAGNTALNLIRLSGDLLGRNVTVTGASGGVGVIAVQLARLAGANVDGRLRGHRRRGRGPGRDPRVGRRRVARPGAREGRARRADPRVRQLVEGAVEARLPRLRGARPRARPVVLLGALRAPRRRQPAHAAGPGGRGAAHVQVGLETPLAEVNDALDALDERRVPGKAILRPR